MRTPLVLAAAAVIVSIFSPLFALAIVALCSLRYRAYEMIAVGLCIDLLFLPPHSLPLATLSSILLVWGLEPLRREFA